MLERRFDRQFYQSYTERRNTSNPSFYEQRGEILVDTYKGVLSDVFQRHLPEGWENDGNLVFDVDSGEGVIGQAVKAISNSKVVSLDIDFQVLDKHCGGFLVNAEAQYLPFLNNSFDILVSTELIEHLSERSGRIFITEAARVLKEGGLLYIEAPNG